MDLLLMGPRAASVAPAFALLGVRKVITIEHADLSDYTAEAYCSALAQFAGQGCYRILGSTTSSASRDYFPRVAARLDIPMASDILAINQLSADHAELTRSVFVGNLLATLQIDAPQWIATCRASEFEPPSRTDQQAPIESAELSGPLAHEGKRFVSLKQQTSDRPDLTEAERIVSGGRGTKGADGLEIVGQLADKLGAGVGCTRAVVDAGWLPNDLQVGQTGKNVAPKLFIAVAISGAIQHLAGMRNSKTIVAINKDPDAPIFEIADIGLVADMFQAVPELIEAI